MTTTVSDLHRHVVQAASLAPSVHNTQPWRFAPFPGGLDLFADPTRQLAVLDRDGRQLHLSCGAALLHARVAARAVGLDVHAELLPDPGDPTHLARLRLDGGSPPSPAEVALAEAMLRRNTHREAFQPQPVPDTLLRVLQTTAAREGAFVHPVTDPDALLGLQVLLCHADQAEVAESAYRRELAAWVRAAPSADGIAAEILPTDPQRGSSLRLRDFRLAPRPPVGDEPPVPESAVVVVLGSDDDTPLSWLQAGQALAAVLLRAAQDGVLAQPLGQLTDLDGFRWRLRNTVGLLGVPQLALRMGYAQSRPATARRDVDDVLTGTRPSPGRGGGLR